MNDFKDAPDPDVRFRHRVSTAARSAWWVFAIGYGLLMLSYCIYVWAVPSHPAWLLTMWGGGVQDWNDMQRWWLGAIIVFKLEMWSVALAAMWLTLWARMLRTS